MKHYFVLIITALVKATWFGFRHQRQDMIMKSVKIVQEQSWCRTVKEAACVCHNILNNTPVSLVMFETWLNYNESLKYQMDSITNDAFECKCDD